MEQPNIRIILVRSAYLVGGLIVFLYVFGLYKKWNRQSDVIAALRQVTGDSSYFHQFSEDEARKTLIRALGLVAEAATLGIEPDKAIDKALGLGGEWFKNELAEDDTPQNLRIIRSSLRANYDNLLKLGFKPDYATFSALKNGDLPGIPSGSFAGRKPEIRTLIPAEISPGIEKVIANLQIVPPDSSSTKLSDIQIAAAKQLAKDLYYAQLIEEKTSIRIEKALSEPEPLKDPANKGPEAPR